MTAQNPTLAYYLNDHPHTLFPLNTNRLVIEHASQDISDIVYQKILNKSQPEYSFLQQQSCHASKSGFHLRRTIKLDPIAEWYIYDLIYRNRLAFRKDFSPSRKTFGYRFEQGQPISSGDSYTAFRTAIATARRHFSYVLKFDVATYFNSIYHHDLTAWFMRTINVPSDAEGFGQYLREINGGRSIDCLPQGVHPCKLIGSEFLKFIDNSINVRSELLLRFMDDFYLFSDSEERLTSDFISIQRILGDKGLALNPEKTALGAVAELDVAQTVDAFKRGLLRVRRNMISVSGHRYEVDREEIHADLQPNQVDYLLALLKDPNINEADADLVLSLLHDHGQDVLQRMTALLERFPSLIRSVYNYARSLSDKSELSSLLLVFVKTGRNITEDQLFWIAKLAEDHLSNTPAYRNLLDELYSHPNGTPLSKAKVLEIPEQRFGFDSLREEQLRVGKSDWLAWSAAVGSRAEPAARRNYILAYFAKGSYMNHLISECVSSLP